jgi:MoaA/NifB/PqqE/SkfB family radical SAM enzyme
MHVASSLYSQSKALYQQDRLGDLRAAIQPKPVHVQLILSDLCNQDCSFCAYRMSDGLSTELFATETTHNPNRQISTEKAREIIADCASMGVKAIQFTGGGEPTVHKHCTELIGYAQAHGIETALVTNGVRLDPKNQHIRRLKWLRVSVDAGSAATYAATRRVNQSHWHKVWTNISKLTFDGVLGVGFVVTPSNYHEILDCAAKAKAYGADNIRIGAVFSNIGVHFYDNCLSDAIDCVNQAKALEDDHFKVIDLFGRRIDDLESRPDHPFCGYQYFTTYIGADLNVYRCCNTAYTRHGLLGNLKNQRFRDLAPALAPFDARSCNFCQFKGQNEAINAALEMPEHRNFV